MLYICSYLFYHIKAEFVASGTRLESKVLRQLQRALQPILKNARVEWGEVLQSKIKGAHPTLPPIFEGERLALYYFLEQGVSLEELKFADIALKAETADSDSKTIVFPLKFGEEEMVLHRDGGSHVVHLLAAAAMIKHLSTDKKEGKENKAEIIRLGVKYQLASPFTSFVAVNEREEAVGGSLVHVDTNESLLRKKTGDVKFNSYLAMDIDADVDDEEEENASSDDKGWGVDQLQRQQAPGGRARVASGRGRGGAVLKGKAPGGEMTRTPPASPRHALAKDESAFGGVGGAGLAGSIEMVHTPPASPRQAKNSMDTSAYSLLLGDSSLSAAEGYSDVADVTMHSLEVAASEHKEEEKRVMKEKAEEEEHKRERMEREVLLVDQRRCREEKAVKLRKQKRDEGLSKRRSERSSWASIVGPSGGAAPAMASHSAAPSPMGGPSPPPPAKLVVNAHMRPLDKLVQLQQFNGSWILSPELAELLHAPSKEAVISSIPEGTTYPEAFWITALAMV